MLESTERWLLGLRPVPDSGVGSRVWRTIPSAEPVDPHPRPRLRTLDGIQSTRCMGKLFTVVCASVSLGRKGTSSPRAGRVLFTSTVCVIQPPRRLVCGESSQAASLSPCCVQIQFTRSHCCPATSLHYPCPHVPDRTVRLRTAYALVYLLCCGRLARYSTRSRAPLPHANRCKHTHKQTNRQTGKL